MIAGLMILPQELKKGVHSGIMNSLKICVLVINIVSFIALLPFLVFGIMEFLLGPEEAMQLLKQSNIRWSHITILVLGLAIFLVFLISNELRKILF